MRNIVIILLLLFVSLCSAQPGQPTAVGDMPMVNARIFAGVTDDTIGVLTTPDSVYMQYDAAGEWKLLTSVISDGDTAMVTADDKVAENTLHFMLSRETFWTHSPMVRFEVRNTTQDTCTSMWIAVGKINGACTLHMRADTVGSYVDYGGSTLSGN
jgi:hypothetical protein